MNRETYVVLAAIMIHMCVRALKIGKLDDWIPSRARPIIAVLLGVAASVVDMSLRGVPWRTAMIDGAIAAAVAAFGHDLAIESALGGREIGK